MKNATVCVPKALTVAFCVAAMVLAETTQAQVVRGTVRSKLVGATLDRAQVIAQGEEGKEFGKATTDGNGRFYLVIKSLGKPFSLTVRRLGIVQTTSDFMTYPQSDTIDVALDVEEVGTAPIDTVKVRSTITRANERSLAEAERRGWRVFQPTEVAQRRERATTFPQLMRSLGVAGVIVPSSDSECFRSVRTNKCMTIVVDNRPLGVSFVIPPSEIYFIAVVSQNDAIMQWGQSRAPNGAIAIYTRMYGDKYK